MADLSTTYLGLKLKNPVIVGASNLVTDPDTVQKIEEAGAAAIVFKSLFEEQIQLERMQHDDQLEEYNERNAEMISLFPKIEHAGPELHLTNLRKVVEKVKIPVIASLNCIYDATWVEYAEKLASTGVAALELNFYDSPREIKKQGKDITDQQIAVLQKVKHAVNIPVSVKLSPFYTNPLNVIGRMDETGVEGFVLFNRIFQPDIDIEREELVFPWYLSNEGDHRLALRFTGALYGNIKSDVCANSGILKASDMIQLLLAGASAVQVVTTLYKNGIGQITNMINNLNIWMNKKNYTSIEDFKGKLSKKNINDPFAYKRSQYVDILMKSHDIFKKYPLR
ncbi:MAG TPA: dihydroorotate dehydrogenase-like protein [Bacteroidales bacterium]|mgnify:FL=1|nr:dihydroorotate dehydrogenase-like protein [Bacteroidales bacterium]HPR58416.1 dihydroorotate dehydrogenase-like protein [Bacteroidales bacterium]HRW96805.1 dihydroorotate dehydrogenase-like protein [Bacteroidales bacterium]